MIPVSLLFGCLGQQQSTQHLGSSLAACDWENAPAPAALREQRVVRRQRARIGERRKVPLRAAQHALHGAASYLRVPKQACSGMSQPQGRMLYMVSCIIDACRCPSISQRSSRHAWQCCYSLNRKFALEG